MKAIVAKVLFVLVALYIVVGCGGGGSSTPGTSPTSQTRQTLQAGVARSFMGLAQAGIAGPSSGTTGGTGGGIGFPMIGAFLHQFLPPPSGAAFRPREVGTGGGTDGGGGGIGPNFYFDGYLGLWVDTASTDTSYTLALYSDEGKTQPAGSFQSSFPAGWNTLPYNSTASFSITAGTFSGAHGQYETVLETSQKGHSSFETTWPGMGTDSGQSTWDSGSGTWHYESQDGDRWWKGDGHFAANGSGTSAFSDSAGYKASYVYHANGSGTGRIEGPDPGLPATISWSTTGHIRIVYADGSVEEWDPSDYYDAGSNGGGGSGTTGGTG